MVLADTSWRVVPAVLFLKKVVLQYVQFILSFGFMNSYLKKFLIIFVLLMLVTFGLTFGMIAMINPNDPGSIYTGVGFFLITFLPLLFVSMWYLRRSLSAPSKKEQRLLQTGKKSPAIVMGVEDTGITMNDIYPIVRLLLKVTPSGDSGFEAKIETMVSRVNIPPPGDMV